MKQYIEALEYILAHGENVKNRTGVDTKAIFGYQMRFDLTDGFPAVTTKKLAWNSVVSELLWFLEGSEDERRLAEITFDDDRENLINKKTIWTANADSQGKKLGYLNSETEKFLGPIYGRQWRNFNDTGVDQIELIINQLKSDQDSRRIILTAWNPAKIDKMALPPCHVLAQFRVLNNKLSCQMYQRSADFALGVPFNIASYALLTHMFAQICNLNVGELIHTFGDAHIYNTHIDQINIQTKRIPMKLPSLVMPKFSSLEELLKTKPNQYILEDYNPMPSLKMDMVI